jgi:hypothetical protein
VPDPTRDPRGRTRHQHEPSPGRLPGAHSPEAWVENQVPLSTARAGNRRFGRLSALCAHTQAPTKTYYHMETLRSAKAA